MRLFLLQQEDLSTKVFSFFWQEWPSFFQGSLPEKDSPLNLKLSYRKLDKHYDSLVNL